MAIEDFVRVNNGLETAVKTYRAKDEELSVVLCGTVHHALPDYYRSIKEKMKSMDVVLYELMVDWDLLGFFDCKTLGYLYLKVYFKSFNFLASELKKFLEYNPSIISQNKALLKVTSIDPGWKRCDYTLPEIVHHLNRLYIQSPLKMTDDIRKLILRDRRWREIEKNTDRESFNTAYSDWTLSKTIEELFSDRIFMEMRNQRVKTRIYDYICRGYTKIGIVYGAAHIPSLEEFLIGELGLENTDENWLKAWEF